MGCGVYVAIGVLCGFIGRLSSVLAESGLNLTAVQTEGLNRFPETDACEDGRFGRAGVKPAPTKMAPHERLDLSGAVGTHLSIRGFSRHTNDRRASEGENGLGLVSPRTRRRPPNARGARQRRDLVSANVTRRTF